MQNLYDFECLSDIGVPLCVLDGRPQCLINGYTTVQAYTNTVDKHPNVHITREMIHPVKSGEEGKALFLPVAVPFLKQLTQAYVEAGFIEMLQTAAKRKQFFLSNLAEILLKIRDQYQRLQIICNPHIRHSGVKLINSISQTRNWEVNIIRCIAWHPYCVKIAVATCDDSVRVYLGDSSVAPLLKCKQQHNITCLAWRPLSNSEIAVGCETGIFIWHVDPSTVVTRPSSSSAIILQRIEHRPVMSIAWGPRGDILASAAACDQSILIWNVEMNQTSSLKRPGGYGNTLIEWSPTGEKLFSASVGIVFRVWECQTWQSERWEILTGRVQSACWSPCGTCLLFATTDAPTIFGLTFMNSKMVFSADTNISPNAAAPLFDLSKVEINGAVVGGLVQNMLWDPRGKHVAVLFQDTNFVAIFTASVQPILNLMACCLISGSSEEIPTAIDFQKSFEHGSCLSIGWSSGRLQHFPLLYTDLKKSYRSLNDTVGSTQQNISMSQFF